MAYLLGLTLCLLCHIIWLFMLFVWVFNSGSRWFWCVWLLFGWFAICLRGLVDFGLFGDAVFCCFTFWFVWCFIVLFFVGCLLWLYFWLFWFDVLLVFLMPAVFCVFGLLFCLLGGLWLLCVWLVSRLYVFDVNDFHVSWCLVFLMVGLYLFISDCLCLNLIWYFVDLRAVDVDLLIIWVLVVCWLGWCVFCWLVLFWVLC